MNKNSVVLQTAIDRAGKKITEITITNALAKAKSLAGLRLLDVMMSDVDTLSKLLPRVTDPALTQAEVLGLDTWDFAQLCQQVAVFLQPSLPPQQESSGENLIT